MRKPVIWITSVAAAAALIAAGTAVAFAAGSASSTRSPSATLTDDSTERSASPAPSTSATPATSPTPSTSPAASDIEAAIAAALAATGPGTVIDADVDDNVAYEYEIDVRLDSGGVVEVKLNSSLDVVSSETNDRGGDDDRGSGHGGSDDD